MMLCKTRRALLLNRQFQLNSLKAAFAVCQVHCATSLTVLSFACFGFQKANLFIGLNSVFASFGLNPALKLKLLS